MKFWRFFLLLGFGLVFASCRSVPKGPKDTGLVPHEVQPEDVAAVDAFKKNGGKGGFLPAPESIKGPLTPQNSGFVIDLDAQRGYFYQGSRLIAFTPIASGRRYYRTETGDYTIGQKDLNHRSTSYGNFVNAKGGTMMSDVQEGFDPLPPGGRFEGSLMKYFLRLYHNGAPTAMGLHRGVLPGYAASHGCIRLPGNMAEWFFTNIPLGTPVMVRGKENGMPIGASQHRPRRAPKIHPSLKDKPAVEKVPPAPESDIKTPEPIPGNPPPGDPATPPAPAPPPPSGAGPN